MNFLSIQAQKKRMYAFCTNVKKSGKNLVVNNKKFMSTRYEKKQYFMLSEGKKKEKSTHTPHEIENEARQNISIR